EDAPLRVPAVRDLGGVLEVVPAVLALLLALGLALEHRVVGEMAQLDRKLLVDLLGFRLGDHVVGPAGQSPIRRRLVADPGTRWRGARHPPESACMITTSSPGLTDASRSRALSPLRKTFMCLRIRPCSSTIRNRIPGCRRSRSTSSSASVC